MSSLFLGMLALSFAVWGIADVFTGGSEAALATVGGSKVTRAEYQQSYQQQTRNQRNPDGSPLTPDQIKEQQIPQQVLQSLISRKALDNETERLGVVTSEAEVVKRVKQIPAFLGPTGTFDHNTFLQRIDPLGYTEQSFMAAVRGDATRSQILNATHAGFAIAPGYARMLFTYLNEFRAAEYIVLTPADAGDVGTPTDAQLLAEMKKHADRFSSPEYRDVVVASIGPDDVMKDVKVTPDQIKQAYEERKSTYIVPEKRDIEQIKFNSEAEARDARAKIEAGTSFADIGKIHGLRADDLKLGTLVEADLAEAGKEVFALPEGGVSQPVKRTFGWFLYRVAKITPGTSKSLADATPELEKEIGGQLAQARIGDLMNAFEDARAGGASLESSAKKVGMHVTHIPALDAKGFSPDNQRVALPDDLDLMKQIFAADVGEEGDPFATVAGNTFVLKVNGVTPPKLYPLDKSRADATAWWRAEQQQKNLLEKAAALTKQANSDQTLAGIAGRMKKTPQQTSTLRRNQRTPPLSEEVVNKLFAVKGGTAVFGTDVTGANVIIARVTGVIHPPLPLGDPQYQAGVAQIGQAVAGDLDTSLSVAARNEQGVKINDAAVNAAMGEGQ